jgi:hypothetical protein
MQARLWKDCEGRQRRPPRLAEQAVITATSVAKAYAVLIDRKGGNEQEGYFSRF